MRSNDKNNTDSEWNLSKLISKDTKINAPHLNNSKF